MVSKIDQKVDASIIFSILIERFEIGIVEDNF